MLEQWTLFKIILIKYFDARPIYENVWHACWLATDKRSQNFIENLTLIRGDVMTPPLACINQNFNFVFLLITKGSQSAHKNCNYLLCLEFYLIIITKLEESNILKDNYLLPPLHIIENNPFIKSHTTEKHIIHWWEAQSRCRGFVIRCKRREKFASIGVPQIESRIVADSSK